MASQDATNTVSEGLRHRKPHENDSEGKEKAYLSSATAGQASMAVPEAEGWSADFERPSPRAGDNPTPGTTQIARTPPSNQEIRAVFFRDIFNGAFRQVGGGSPGKYYCTACAEATLHPHWLARIQDLFESAAWCLSCEAWRYRSNFAPAERPSVPECATKPGYCVTHSGVWWLCAHRGYTWGDIKLPDWSREKTFERREGGGWKVSVQCEHQDHTERERPTFTIMFEEGQKKEGQEDGTGGQYMANIHQSIFSHQLGASPDRIDLQVEGCMTRLFALLDAGATKLCPHLQTSPELVLDFSAHERYGDDPMSHWCKCHLCGFAIWFHLADGVNRKQPRMEISKSLRALDRFGQSSLERSSWDTIAGPESYGLFSDMETKNILWCDDRKCATTFQLAACYANMKMVGRFFLHHVPREGSEAARRSDALRFATTAIHQESMHWEELRRRI